ncbi:MAG: AAA family ATPase [Methanobrevibacter sp.]|nr:AAA family ATPase [Methanobrevibacter sp.]
MPLSTNIPNVKPIDAIEERKKLQTSFFRRLFITTWHGGKGIRKDIPFGHYMFSGPQGSGKTASMLWYYEFLTKKYTKRGYEVKHVFSNFGVFDNVDKLSLFPTIYRLAVKKDGTSRYKKDDKIINFILLDEFHSYFPKDFTTKEDRELISLLISRFSQLRKAHLFILSTAQIYGSLDKRLREQCLYMVSSRKSKLSNHIISDFYKQEDILCDELGRWSGIPSHVYSHGLPKHYYDTSRLVNS